MKNDKNCHLVNAQTENFYGGLNNSFTYKGF